MDQLRLLSRVIMEDEEGACIKSTRPRWRSSWSGRSVEKTVPNPTSFETYGVGLGGFVSRTCHTQVPVPSGNPGPVTPKRPPGAFSFCGCRPR